jgi:hypothetical protein
MSTKTAIIISSLVYMSGEAFCKVWIILCSLPSSFNYALGLCMYQLAANSSRVPTCQQCWLWSSKEGQVKEPSFIWGCTEFEPMEITTFDCNFCTVYTIAFVARWMWFLSSLSVLVCIKNLIALYIVCIKNLITGMDETCMMYIGS